MVDNQNQAIDMNKKVIEYINTTKNNKFLTFTPKECQCYSDTFLKIKYLEKEMNEIIKKNCDTLKGY